MNVRKPGGASADAMTWPTGCILPGDRPTGRLSTSVVVIEDDQVLSTAMIAALHDKGHDAEALFSADGIERALTTDPLLIVLDVSLHLSDAVDVLKALAEQGYGGTVQLISGGRTDLLERVKRVGERRGMAMLPVLRKPFAMADLQAIVEREARTVTGGDRTRSVVAAQSPIDRIDLGVALDQRWVEVWYQPKYDARTLALVGAECLCRVMRPDVGLMEPDIFLPDAALADMRMLTEHVLAQACADWPLFDDAGLGLRLAINIPCALLVSMPLAKLLRQWSPKAANWPGLVFEVTEEQALDDIDAAHEVGTQLEIYGVDLAIDDFGTGYASLARLREMPFKEIKLDRTLVDGCARDPTRAALCRTIVDLSHTLGAITVAEGVETPEDLACLRGIGSDVAQGFLLGRPMTRDMLVAEIRDGRDRGWVLRASGSLLAAP